MQSYSHSTKAYFLKKFHTTLIISMHNKLRKGERQINRNGEAVWLASSERIMWVFAPSCKIVPSKTKLRAFQSPSLSCNYRRKWGITSAVVLWFWRAFSLLEKCYYCGDGPFDPTSTIKRQVEVSTLTDASRTWFWVRSQGWGPILAEWAVDSLTSM